MSTVEIIKEAKKELAAMLIRLEKMGLETLPEDADEAIERRGLSYMNVF